MAELLYREIGLILQTEAKDPRLGQVVITGVKASEDLRQATVFFSVWGEDKAAVIDSLDRAHSFIRSCVGRRCYLKYVPQLHFKLDQTLEQAARIDRIIDRLHAEDDPGMREQNISTGESED